MSKKARSTLREYVEAALWALVLTLFLRAFVIQAFRIPSESMKDTLLVGDFLFVNKFEYGPKIPFTDVRLPGVMPLLPKYIVTRATCWAPPGTSGVAAPGVIHCRTVPVTGLGVP